MLKWPFERRERCSMVASSDPCGVEAAVRTSERSEVVVKFAEVVVDGEFVKPVIDQELLLFVQHHSLVDANFFCQFLDLSQFSAKWMVRLRVAGEHIDAATSGQDGAVDGC